MRQLTFWYEFASTYSYLTAMRIDDLASTKGVSVEWRPFLLGPIFKSQGLDTSPFNIYKTKGDYMWLDMERCGAKQGLPPITRPEPFPQNGLLAARIATLGIQEGWGQAFSQAVYHAQFAEGKRIDDRTLLANLVSAAGGDGESAIARAQEDTDLKDTLRSATDEAAQLGIFGAPSFTTPDGALFWGNDRLEDSLDWVLAHAG